MCKEVIFEGKWIDNQGDLKKALGVEKLPLLSCDPDSGYDENYKGMKNVYVQLI